MQEQITVLGIILSHAHSSENDARLSILTDKCGKITAFCRGARRPGSGMAAKTQPFCFGEFRLLQGRDAYTLLEVTVKNYFQELHGDVEKSLYASYFAEIADYYCRENNDELGMLKLLYQTLLVMTKDILPNPLLRFIYEMKSLAVNGEYPGSPQDMVISESARYTMDFIGLSSIEKLYSFDLTPEVFSEVRKIADIYLSRYRNHHFKSLEILDTLC